MAMSTSGYGRSSPNGSLPAVEPLRPVARATARQLIAELTATDQCDFVTDFAEPYVMKTTSQFVGFREEEVIACWAAVKCVGSAMKDLGNRIADLDDGLVLLADAHTALHERLQHPADDILTLVADEMSRGSLPRPSPSLSWRPCSRPVSSRRSTSSE